MRIIKATASEKAEYAKTGPVYPLYGFIRVDGQRCAVEDLRGKWSRPDPVWEVVAPAGYRFAVEGLHSMLGEDHRELLDRVVGLEECPSDCDCREV